MAKKVKVLRSFADVVNGKIRSFNEGDIIDLVPGKDWVDVGFVEPVRGRPKTATRSKATKTPDEVR